MKQLVPCANLFRAFPALATTSAIEGNDRSVKPASPSAGLISIWLTAFQGRVLTFRFSRSQYYQSNVNGACSAVRSKSLSNRRLPFLKALAIGLPSLLLSASHSPAQVTVTPNVPAYPFQVLAGSTRQINVNISGGTLNTVNWSVLSTTGGASATFTTPAGADVSSVAGALATVQVNIGPTQGNCTISGSGTYKVTSTATVTVQAQSTDDPSKTAAILFNVCANSPATLANGTKSVIVAPAYQQAYQSQPMTLQSWVVGCTDESGTWSIVSQPSGGNGTLVDTTNRDTVFSASVTGRYTLQYSANCNSGTNTGIVYVSPNPMPSYASTPNGTRPHECYADPALTGGDYEVGAGKAYPTISATPALTGWAPGTIMRVWNTDTTGSNPTVYNEYYNVQKSGTPAQPIIICGVADSQGNLPIMDGTNAKAQSDVDIAAGDGLIILWPGASHYGYWQDGSAGPSYVSITGLHLRNANSNLNRYSPGSSSSSPWSNFSGCINWRAGSFIDISGNQMENCSNGLFSDDNDANAWATITQNLTFMGNHVQGAGDPNYPVSTHQLYVQTYYALAEGNRLDNPSQYVGSQVKWRGVEGIFRYNYLGDGAERLFDLVDNQDGPDYMTFEFYFSDGQWANGDTAGANVIAAYQESSQKDFIYGNELLSTTSEAAIHYAGDQGTTGILNRSGILHFYSNTLDNAHIIFDNGFAGNGLNSYFQPRVDARNNILWPRTVAWTGLVQMEFGKFAPIVLDATTNLSQTGTFTITPPILGAVWQDGTQAGWPTICDNTCPWPLAVPLNTHLYGLNAANYLTTATQPYDGTTFIPPSGSPAIGAGTSITDSPLVQMPVRWQYYVATGALTPRLFPLTIGAADQTNGTPMAATPTFSPGSGTYSSAQTVTISSSTPGATIYYTTDGSTPTTGSQSYSGPITISKSEAVSAIAVATGFSNSATGSATYVITLGQVATPTFSPAAGTFSSTQTVSISDSTAGATIYYTTNGTTPTTSSPVYTGTISVSSTETIKALAVVSGYTNSAVASATFTISLAQAATPTFSPAAGTYTSAQTVAISSTTPSVTIYYTTNGTTPTTSSAVYSVPIAVSSSETIKTIATASGFSNSAVATSTYSINSIGQVATPTFTPAPGTYTSAQSVTISSVTPSTTIYYTTNGTTPTTSSAVYSGPITVSSSETVEAIATASGSTNSAVGTAAYTINQVAADFSVSSSPTSLTVTSAQPATATISVMPVNGFNSTVSMTCTGLPAGASCIFTLPSVKAAGAPASTTLTVSMTGTTTTLVMNRNSSPLFPGSALAVALCCISWKKRRRLQMLLLLVISVTGLTLLNGCGGATFASNASHATVVSPITVTGTSGGLQHSATITVTMK